MGYKYLDLRIRGTQNQVAEKVSKLESTLRALNRAGYTRTGGYLSQNIWEYRYHFGNNLSRGEVLDLARRAESMDVEEFAIGKDEN